MNDWGLLIIEVAVAAVVPGAVEPGTGGGGIVLYEGRDGYGVYAGAAGGGWPAS